MCHLRLFTAGALCWHVGPALRGAAASLPALLQLLQVSLQLAGGRLGRRQGVMRAQPHARALQLPLRLAHVAHLPQPGGVEEKGAGSGQHLAVRGRQIQLKGRAGPCP